MLSTLGHINNKKTTYFSYQDEMHLQSLKASKRNTLMDRGLSTHMTVSLNEINFRLKV